MRTGRRLCYPSQSMWWPIRNQILVPFAAVLVVAVAATAVTAAYLAARRSEDSTVRQLRAVTHTLDQTNFPLTKNVLEKMHGLSGAHFVVCGADGRIVESTLPQLATLPAGPPQIQGPDDLGSLGQNPKLTVAGVSYFVASLQAPGRPDVSALLVLYPEQSWRQARWDAAVPPLAVGSAALAVMVGVAFWLAHRFSGRIRLVQQQVGRIAAGKFREIDLGPRRDEIRELVGSVNQMCAQLRQLQDTVRQSERSRLLGQLAAGLAHQLRNAITGARMAAQIHAKRCHAEPSDESLHVVLRQLALTEEQVKGILSLGRGERKPPVQCDLEQLAGEVALLVTPACHHAHVDFRQETRVDGRQVLGDLDGLRAAMLNLTLNAIEAAGPGGRVCLRVAADDGELRVEVSDSGAGPPAEIRESLFDPFVTSKPEGVGLGLALARQVATEHGGRLAWERVEGETRFRMLLPVV